MKKQRSTNTSATKPKSQTDWVRLAAMKPEDIDLSDIPETTPEEFARAVVRRGLNKPVAKKQITLRIDGDVLEWFKAKGKGYQVEINALLKAYVEAHKKAG